MLFFIYKFDNIFDFLILKPFFCHLSNILIFTSIIAPKLHSIYAKTCRRFDIFLINLKSRNKVIKIMYNKKNCQLASL
jgi:hypothetical protein